MLKMIEDKNAASHNLCRIKEDDLEMCVSLLQAMCARQGSYFTKYLNEQKKCMYVIIKWQLALISRL